MEIRILPRRRCATGQADRAVILLQAPLYGRSNLFFFFFFTSGNTDERERSLVHSFADSFPPKGAMPISFRFHSRRNFVSKGVAGNGCVDYIYRLPANTWRGWLQLVKLAISVISAGCKFRFCMPRVASRCLPSLFSFRIADYARA